MLQQNPYFFSNFFHKNVNQCKVSKFQSDLKLADVTPCSKKKSKISKDNYRPISILPNISRICDIYIYI